MKLNDLRARLRTELPKPVPWDRKPCPKCGRKRKKKIVKGIVELRCNPCGLMWKASPYKCALCEDELTNRPGNMCEVCHACARECPNFFATFIARKEGVKPSYVLFHRKKCPVCIVLVAEGAFYP